MVQLECFKHNCHGTMNLIGIAQSGTLFYWCPDCKRFFIISDTDAQEYRMKVWQSPVSWGTSRGRAEFKML